MPSYEAEIGHKTLEHLNSYIACRAAGRRQSGANIRYSSSGVASPQRRDPESLSAAPLA
jgi:hypothetical protein